MARERIRKLAKRLNVEIDEAVGLLASLGHGRYRSPDDILPEPVAAELERALKRPRPTPARPSPAAPPPPPAAKRPVAPVTHTSRDPGPLEPLPAAFPDDNHLNAALREYLSAQPLAQLKKSLPSAPVKTETPPPRPTEELLRESLGAEIRQRRLVTEALEAARADLARLLREASAREQALAAERDHAFLEREEARTTLTTRTAELEAHGQALRLELDRLLEADRQVRLELDAARARLKDELIARQVAEGRITQLERRVRELEHRPEPPPPPAPVFPSVISSEIPAVTPLDELLEQRGLTSPAEVQAAFQGLLREELYYETMELLATANPVAMRNLLRRKLVLVCESCEPPAGVAAVQVEANGRCEVCRGSGVAQAAQAFLAACQARGITRVNVVGGSPRYLSELKQLLGSSIRLRGIEGTGSPDGRRARQHVEGADLTIVWGRTILKHKVSNLYVDLNDPRVIQVVHRGIGGMLRLAAEALEHRLNRVGQK